MYSRRQRYPRVIHNFMHKVFHIGLQARASRHAVRRARGSAHGGKRWTTNGGNEKRATAQRRSTAGRGCNPALQTAPATATTHARAELQHAPLRTTQQRERPSVSRYMIAGLAGIIPHKARLKARGPKTVPAHPVSNHSRSAPQPPRTRPPAHQGPRRPTPRPGTPPNSIRHAARVNSFRRFSGKKRPQRRE